MRAAIIVTSSLRLMHNIDMLPGSFQPEAATPMVQNAVLPRRLAFSEVNMIVTPIISALARSLPHLTQFAATVLSVILIVLRSPLEKPE